MWHLFELGDLGVRPVDCLRFRETPAFNLGDVGCYLIQEFVIFPVLLRTRLSSGCLGSAGPTPSRGEVVCDRLTELGRQVLRQAGIKTLTTRQVVSKSLCVSSTASGLL